MSKKKLLRFGLPKGSLEKPTIEKMAKAGFNIRVSNRSLVPYVDDPEIEIRLIRAQEISRYVELGYLDCGITGLDWIMENGSKVHEVTELLFSRATRRPARWVLCVPEESPIRSVKGLKGKRVATEVVNLTRKYLRKNGVKANVEFSWGATEVKARLHPPADFQPPNLEERLETEQDRDHRNAPARRARRRDQGRHEIQY